MQKKIEQWQKELEKIAEKQKEMNQKYNEQTKNLQEKIREGKRVIQLQENQMIADMIRDVFGDIHSENLEQLKRQLEHMVSEQTDDSQNH